MSDRISVDRITEPVDAVGESPIWREGEAALYWVDITASRIHRLELASARRDSWRTPEQIGCIAFDTFGDLIAGMETGMFQLALKADARVEAVCVAAPDFPFADMRFNDGRCDRQGRFWAGTMHKNMASAHAVGALYCLHPNLVLSEPVVTGLVTQNGLAWSPDGRVMYLADSHPTVRKIWSFDYDIENGRPRNRRLFVDMNLHPGRPDGAAVDVDGCYWICANDGGMLHRFTPAGALDRSIPLPVKKPAMCAFGGAKMDTLFVTSIRPVAAADLADQPDAGAVFALQPGVQGLQEAPFHAPAAFSATIARGGKGEVSAIRQPDLTGK
ncbi:MAG: SMP-30/gluconolactonase/LRE family protein [Betaproteobacteria bacterium]|nr:SMP-30/gluconolactonase/LRE family protein [Betaproteobacteria bacterium]